MPEADAGDGVVGPAVRATYVAFVTAGVAFASWAARIPQIRDRLQLSPSELGFVLLALAGGSLLALPAAGPLVNRLGSRRTVTATALLVAVGLLATGIGHQFGVLPLVLGLFLTGLGVGSWDVAMNVHGALAERRLQRSVMPRFHAGFSLGTVVGAGTAAVLVAWRVPVAVHLAAVAVGIAVVVPLGVRPFLPDHDAAGGGGSGTPPALSAWTERRTLLIGVFVLAFAFAEGTANDWITVAFLDGHGFSPALGTAGFALFLAAMTAGRWFGVGLLDRFGRVPVVRATSVAAVVGVAVFVLGNSAPLAFAGAALWGAGVSMGFPVGMSAGADDPARAAARVSVISSIGYCAFLAGPPAVGFLGQRFTVLRALTVVAVLLGVAALVAGQLRPADTRDAVGLR